MDVVDLMDEMGKKTNFSGEIRAESNSNVFFLGLQGDWRAHFQQVTMDQGAIFSLYSLFR